MLDTMKLYVNEPGIMNFVRIKPKIIFDRYTQKPKEIQRISFDLYMTDTFKNKYDKFLKNIRNINPAVKSSFKTLDDCINFKKEALKNNELKEKHLKIKKSLELLQENLPKEYTCMHKVSGRVNFIEVFNKEKEIIDINDLGSGDKIYATLRGDVTRFESKYFLSIYVCKLILIEKKSCQLMPSNTDSLFEGFKHYMEKNYDSDPESQKTQELEIWESL